MNLFIFPATMPRTSLWASAFQKRNRIALADEAGFNDGAIERHPAIEFIDDALEDAAVLLQRVGIIGRHYATPAKLRGFNHGPANPQAASRPAPLVKILNTADHDIRPQTASIKIHVGDRPIGCHQQWENVEAADTFVVRHAGPWPNGVSYQPKSFSGVPAMTGDERHAIRSERGLQTQQTMMSS
jgi:hypothetical protein